MRKIRLNTWTPERTDTLCKLWRLGMYASEIGQQLGGLTRNSVIGKARRLGLPAHDVHTKRVNHTRSMGARKPKLVPPAPPRRYVHNPIGNIPQKLETRKREKAADKTLPIQAREDVGVGLVTIETLGAHMCKWPIGETRDPGFTYCGRLTDSTYCRVHAAIAFVPLKPRQPRNGNELARSLRRFM